MTAVFTTDFDNLHQLLLKHYKTDKKCVGNTTVYTVCINGKKVIFAEVGNTKAYVGYNIGSICMAYPVSDIICIGNAGSLCKGKSKIYDIAVADESIQYDVDFSALGIPKTVIPDINKAAFQSNSSMVSDAKKCAKCLGYCADTGRMASADRFLASDDERSDLQKMLNVAYADTECCTIAECCYIKKVPFVCVKGISNYAGDNAPSEYYLNRECANKKAFDVVLKMLAS